VSCIARVRRTDSCIRWRFGVTIVFFNFLGLGMFVASWTVAFIAADALGLAGEGPRMVVAGPMAVLLDGLFRWRHPAGHWLNPTGGGNVLFIPVWVFGVFWTLLGLTYCATGQDEPGVLGGLIIGLVAVAILGVAVFRGMRSESSSSQSSTSEDWECSRCAHWNRAHVRFCKNCQLEIPKPT